MKALMLLILISISFTAWGTILTVDNRTPSGGQYNSFNDAYTVAASGDSLFLFQSPLPYSISNNISKHIHICGGGFYYAYNESSTYKTEINSNNVLFTAGSASSSMSGVIVNGQVTLGDNDICISNCNITNYLTITGNNQIIKQSKIRGINIISGYSNILIDKCYVYGIGYSSYGSYGIKLDGSNTVTINNGSGFRNYPKTRQARRHIPHWSSKPLDKIYIHLYV